MSQQDPPPPFTGAGTAGGTLPRLEFPGAGWWSGRLELNAEFAERARMEQEQERLHPPFPTPVRPRGPDGGVGRVSLGSSAFAVSQMSQVSS
eukprot:3564534-Rhodomonas_salina.1